MPENNRIQAAPVLNLLPAVRDGMCLFLKISVHTQVFLSTFWTSIEEFLKGDH